MNSETRRLVLAVLLSSFLRQSSLASTNVTSALQVFKNDMLYINPRFPYLLTYKLEQQTSTYRTFNDPLIKPGANVDLNQPQHWLGQYAPASYLQVVKTTM